MFDTKAYDEKFEAAIARFEGELKKVRTGRAHPSMLEGVHVSVYGTMMPLNQAANITAPEPQMLLVTPFDPANLPAISAAIRDDPSSDFNPSDDGRLVRVPVPALTEERRKLLVKQTAEKVEDARIALRTIRQDAFKEIKRMKDGKEFSEDDAKRSEKAIDDTMTHMNSEVENLFKAKEKDILTL